MFRCRMSETPPFADVTPLSCFPLYDLGMALTSLGRSFDQYIGASAAIIGISGALTRPSMIGVGIN